MSTPRIAFLDVETAPILANVWTLYETNAVWVERDTFLLSFSVLWDGEKKVKTYCLPDYPGYAKDPHNDRRLVHDLHRIMDAADIIVAHNGDAFDIKKINSRLAVHGFNPPSPFKTIDTLKIARRHFKFDSNKLDNLGRYLNCGRKIQNMGAELWRRCINGDPKAWEWMRRYNGQDVLLLEKVFHKLKAWGKIPDLRLYGNGECPTCLSNDVQRRGTAVARSKRYQRFQCQACGSWFSGEQEKHDAQAKTTIRPRSKAPQLRSVYP
jgi:uncharacterized protein YprB with RNaseH-like and TPR domain